MFLYSVFYTVIFFSVMTTSHLFFYSLLIHARKTAWLGMLVTRRRAAWNALGVIAFFLPPPVWMSPFLVIFYSPALSLLPPSVRAAQISFHLPYSGAFGRFCSLLFTICFVFYLRNWRSLSLPGILLSYIALRTKGISLVSRILTACNLTGRTKSTT